MLDQLAFVDVETTGLRPLQDRIIEVGVVLVDKNTVVDTYESLVNPKRSISYQIGQITGISNEELFAAPSFEEIESELFEKLEDRVLVAHNARFDYGFLRAEFSRVGKELRVPQLCTVRLSRKLFPTVKGHGLDALIQRFNLPIEARHRAMGDVEATWEFYRRALSEKGSAFLSEAQEIIKRPALPKLLDEKRVDALPETSGVYIFYDSKGEVLYVGKSINIKQRVLSHFYDDLRNKKEFLLKQKIADIEVHQTAGEMGALLLEEQLVKQYSPVYNRRLKRKKNLAILKLDSDEKGYLRPVVKRVKNISPDDLSEVVRVFGSERRAHTWLKKMAKEHSFCWKIMGLESGEGACFGYHLDECLGACVGEEGVIKHNRRLKRLFAAEGMRAWGDAALLVREHDSDNDRAATHIFDRFCYVGTAESETEVHELLNASALLEFNLDVYRILVAQMKKEHRKGVTFKWVKRKEVLMD